MQAVLVIIALGLGRGRQTGLVPIQKKLQPFLLSRILFHAQQFGKIFFCFGYVNSHRSTVFLNNDISRLENFYT
ncbi:MAG: hypothetical protein ACKN9T_19485 [Candidatus Methylumidiphilus sp.]